MKKHRRILITYLISICCSANLVGQNIVIKDTIKNYSNSKDIKSDSSFTVEGEVPGLDSGIIKIFSPDDSLTAYVPLKKGEFYFSGFVKSLAQVHFLIKGDYYTNSFYLEPGEIKIKYTYQQKFNASGTRENDLSNYFTDTLNKRNTDRFWELSNKIDFALKEADLDVYLKLIDSFMEVEADFFRAVGEAIAQKRYGNYLLSYVNYYYINYGYFSERRAIFDQLPEVIRNTPSGKKALDFLESTKIKNTALINESAYQFTLKDLNNKSLALTNFKGKTIVLDFWASWCIPCVKALPLLKKIHAADVSKNVVYISVSIDKREEDWRGKEKKLQIPWFSLLADEPTIKNYEVYAVPEYIVINKDGVIASKTSSLDKLYSTLKELEK